MANFFLIVILVTLSQATISSIQCASCATGTECQQSTGECIAVSCDAPNACEYGETCVVRVRQCITTPCPQFDCVANPCSNVRCESGQECDTMTGECIAVGCSHAYCPAGTTCQAMTNKRCQRRGPCRQFQCVCPNPEQVYNECGSHCPPTCELLDQEPEMCIDSCNAGCTCPHGTVLSGEHCVDPLECACAPSACGPPLGLMTTQCHDGSNGGPTGRCIRDPATLHCHWEIRACPESCTGNKEYKACGPACQPTCADPSPSEGSCASAPCVEGCCCKSGFILNGATGLCVHPTQCPHGKGHSD